LFLSFNFKSGSIDQKEITTLIQALYELLNFDEANRSDWNSSEKALEIIKKLDQNHDQKLDRNEFIEGCLNDKEICGVLVPYS